MNTHQYTKEELTPWLLAAFEDLASQLPESMGGRLTHSEAVRFHGSRSNLLLFNIWDKHQTNALHRDHFCYCFGYLRNHAGTTKPDGYLHLWINHIRLYHHRADIVKTLLREMPRHCPAPFQYEETDSGLQLMTTFNLPADPARLPGLLLPLYRALIRKMHPILIPIIDSFGVHLSKEERSAVIRSRPKIHVTPPRLNRDELAQYSRSIPPTWRRIVRERYNHQCAICHVDLSDGSGHIDHIIPFSKGGTRSLDNFQLLCAACNLRKGNNHP